MIKGIIFAGLVITGVAAATIAIRRLNMKNKRTHEVISSTEYSTNTKFKKRALKYYIFDDVVCDMYDRVIVNTAKTLGPDWDDDLKLGIRLNADCAHIDDLYLRNYITKTDLKVTACVGSYVHSGNDIMDVLYLTRIAKIIKDAKVELNHA